jgi:hypothetical protein
MKKIYTCLLFFPLLQTGFVFSQAVNVAGTWKGTSICQVKNSPCHDEAAVCHVEKTANPLQYAFTMNKIVDGKEVVMGVLYYAYDSSMHTLLCNDTTHHGLWQFTVTGDKMDGTARFNGQLYRVIHLQKQ